MKKLVYLLFALLVVGCDNTMSDSGINVNEPLDAELESMLNAIEEQGGEIDDEALLNDLQTKAFVYNFSNEFLYRDGEWKLPQYRGGGDPTLHLVGGIWQDSKFVIYFQGKSIFWPKEVCDNLTTDLFIGTESNYTYDVASRTMTFEIIRFPDTCEIETITAEVVYYKDGYVIFKGHMPFSVAANEDYYEWVYYFRGEFSEELRKELEENAQPMPRV